MRWGEGKNIFAIPFKIGIIVSAYFDGHIMDLRKMETWQQHIHQGSAARDIVYSAATPSPGTQNPANPAHPMKRLRKKTI